MHPIDSGIFVKLWKLYISSDILRTCWPWCVGGQGRFISKGTESGDCIAMSRAMSCEEICGSNYFKHFKQFKWHFAQRAGIKQFYSYCYIIQVCTFETSDNITL